MDRAVKLAAVVLPGLLAVTLILFARSWPWYFTNPQYLLGMIFLQVLLACLLFYDRAFFPLLMLVFLWAGLDLPMRESWTAGRWVVLGAGALVGFVRALRMGVHRFSAFHLVASFCIGSAMVSALVSPAPQLSLMKAFSLCLLFLYGASGARLLLRQPDAFFRGLLLACEFSVYGSAFCYLVLGKEVWGNPNSLGAIQGVVVAPLLLWGALVAQEKNLQLRRAAACLGSLGLVCFSVTRAAMLATCLAMLLLLIALRRHKLILQGMMGALCVVALTAIITPSRFDTFKTSLVSGVIYKGHQDQGILGSRLTPWQKTVQVIRENPYFGSGFGTSFAGDKPFGEVQRLASTSALREHGSSYLAIAEWVGLFGVLPFVVLVGLMVHAGWRVFVWVRRTGSPFHYSVPITMVVAAGLAHAAFEDWMFAVGYYMTVLFWTLAFLLMDILPEPVRERGTSVQGMRFRFATPPPAVVRQ